MKPKSHYETIGVPPDASPAEIKRKYRQRADKAHPDRRDGNPDEMVELNQAYAVLSDPSKRLLYDATGEEQRPIDDQVRNHLIQAFADAMGKDSPTILKDARKFLEGAKAKTIDNKRQLDAAVKKLNSRRGRIKTSRPENVFHMIIDAELVKIAQARAVLDEGLKVCDLAIKKLDEYKSTERTPEQKASSLYGPADFTFIQSATTGQGNW